jgi:hypothetical protein
MELALNLIKCAHISQLNKSDTVNIGLQSDKKTFPLPSLLVFLHKRTGGMTWFASYNDSKMLCLLCFISIFEKFCFFESMSYTLLFICVVLEKIMFNNYSQ